MSKQYSYVNGEVVEIHPLTQKKAADASLALSKRGMDWKPGQSTMHVEFAGGVELAYQLVASFEENGQKPPTATFRKRLEDDDDLRGWIIQKAGELRDETQKKSEAEGKNS